jgi:hypothetical protein
VLPYEPAIPLLDICPEELKLALERNICTPKYMQHESQKQVQGLWGNKIELAAVLVAALSHEKLWKSFPWKDLKTE